MKSSRLQGEKLLQLSRLNPPPAPSLVPSPKTVNSCPLCLEKYYSNERAGALLSDGSIHFKTILTHILNSVSGPEESWYRNEIVKALLHLAITKPTECGFNVSKDLAQISYEARLTGSGASSKPYPHGISQRRYRPVHITVYFARMQFETLPFFHG